MQDHIKLEYRQAAEHIKWEKFMILKPGIYQFKFRVEGIWLLLGDGRVRNMGEFTNHEVLVESSRFRENTSCELASVPLKQLPKVKELGGYLNPDSFAWRRLQINGLEWLTIRGHSLSYNGDKLFLFGGLIRDAYSAQLFEINLLNKVAKRLSTESREAPAAVGWHRAIVFGQKLLILGGMDTSAIRDSYHSFNPFNSQWTHRADQRVLKQREHFSAVSILEPSRVFIFGGHFLTRDLEAEFNYDDIAMLDLIKMDWTTLSIKGPKPPGRHLHSANMFDEKMVIFGGLQLTGIKELLFNDFYRIDLSSIKTDPSRRVSWDRLEIDGDKPSPRYGHSSVKYKNNLLIHGGVDAARGVLGDTYVVNFETLVSSKVSFTGKIKELPRAYHEMVIVENTFYLFGGQSSKAMAKFPEPQQFLYQLNFEED